MIPGMHTTFLDACHDVKRSTTRHCPMLVMAAHFTSTNDLNPVPAFTQNKSFSHPPSYNQDVNLTTAFTVEDFTVQTNVTRWTHPVTCDFTIEDLTPAADPYPAGMWNFLHCSN